MLTDEVMALKLSIVAKDSGLPLPRPISSGDNDNEESHQSDDSSEQSESSDDDEISFEADDEREEPEQELIEPKFNRSTTSHDHQSKMTEGGFKFVCKSGKSSRTFTNSSLRFNQQADGRLKTVNCHDRSNKICSVFVSNLTTDTKSADVVSFRQFS